VLRVETYYIQISESIGSKPDLSKIFKKTQEPMERRRVGSTLGLGAKHEPLSTLLIYPLYYIRGNKHVIFDFEREKR